MPFAYGLREHQIFDVPIRVDRAKTIRQPTPEPWQKELKEKKVEVVPLVEDVSGKYPSGWCTYTRDFAELPEVEVFCGGINTKMPSAAAIWRQGNLLHFGFEQTPKEMNEVGRALLINSIVYISRFTQDRPITRTPAGWGNRPFPRLRAWPESYITNTAKDSHDLSFYFTAATLSVARTNNRAETRKWFQEVRDYLRPDEQGKLMIDEDAKALQIAPDKAEFFAKAIAALPETDERSERAQRLLRRCAPEGPINASPATAVQEWNAWWEQNRDYLLYSEAGGYRWYVDSLARKRGIPTAQLRGPARADLPEEKN